MEAGRDDQVLAPRLTRLVWTARMVGPVFVAEALF